MFRFIQDLHIQNKRALKTLVMMCTLAYLKTRRQFALNSVMKRSDIQITNPMFPWDAFKTLCLPPACSISSIFIYNSCYYDMKYASTLHKEINSQKGKFRNKKSSWNWVLLKTCSPHLTKSKTWHKLLPVQQR